MVFFVWKQLIGLIILFTIFATFKESKTLKAKLTVNQIL